MASYHPTPTRRRLRCPQARCHSRTSLALSEHTCTMSRAARVPSLASSAPLSLSRSDCHLGCHTQTNKQYTQTNSPCLV
jgi:hypothetical protein